MRRRLPVKRVEHSALNSRGGSRAWTRLVQQVVKEEPFCWLRLPGCRIHSQTADHYHPRKYRPDLTMQRSNLRGCCNHCNRTRRETPVHELPRLRAELEAKAKPARALGFFR